MADDALECGLEPGVEMADEDQAVVTAARQDTEAPGRLYDKYYSVILGYIYHCTLDRTATEDLTSNVFLAACGHLGRYRWRQTPSGRGRIASPRTRCGCTTAGTSGSGPSVLGRSMRRLRALCHPRVKLRRRPLSLSFSLSPRFDIPHLTR